VNHLNPKTFEKQYKEHLCDFREWKKEVNAEALVYPENFGKYMSIDEVALSKDELYTVITNKEAHGKKGALAALIKGTKGEIVSKALAKVPIEIRMKVKEITMDFANVMDWICRTNFMNATLVGDRFHAQQIVSEGVQEIRIRLRRKAIDDENEMMMECRKQKISFRPQTYANGDTQKQLLARGRYILFKPSNKWSHSQRERAEIMFQEFPELKKAYDLAMYFRNIFETAKTQVNAKIRFHKWFEKVSISGLSAVISSANTMEQQLGKILNYFPNGSTNASAESFNARLKGFRLLVRGVSDVDFFLYRIVQLYV
jgi:transposase